MKKLLKKIWIEMSNHNRYKSIATILCIVFLVWFQACQIKVHSVLNPEKTISVYELQSEYDTFMNAFNDRVADVNEQVRFREFLWKSALEVATTGSFDWLMFLASAGSAVGAGALADNIRYRIKKR